MKYSSGAIALIAVCGFLPGSVALADGSGLLELQTPLKFQINPPAPGVPGDFGIVKPEPDSDSAVTYLLDSNVVQFNISDRDGDTLDNPLFCFDYAANGENGQLLLDISSVDGKTALKRIGFDSDIQYSLDGNRISVTPPASSQCFYRGLAEDEPEGRGEFGLYGRAAETLDDGSSDSSDGPIFRDRFEAEMKLEISFQGLPDSAARGTGLSYDLVVRNAGQVALSAVSFQEVYPTDTDLNLYPVSMAGEAWSCDNDLVGEGVVRVEQVPIAAGEAVTCTINREVSGSGTLRLHAAAVSGPGVNALFDVAEVEVTVE